VTDYNGHAQSEATKTITTTRRLDYYAKTVLYSFGHFAVTIDNE